MTYVTPQTVQAVAMTAPGKTEMRTYPNPTMDHDSAILKVEMSGICGTDRHIFKGEATELRGKSIFPYVGGHEVIGTIVEIGDNAARTMDYDGQLLVPGDRVAIAVEVNAVTVGIVEITTTTAPVRIRYKLMDCIRTPRTPKKSLHEV